MEAELRRVRQRAVVAEHKFAVPDVIDQQREHGIAVRIRVVGQHAFGQDRQFVILVDRVPVVLGLGRQQPHVAEIEPADGSILGHVNRVHAIAKWRRLDKAVLGRLADFIGSRLEAGEIVASQVVGGGGDGKPVDVEGIGLHHGLTGPMRVLPDDHAVSHRIHRLAEGPSEAPCGAAERLQQIAGFHVEDVDDSGVPDVAHELYRRSDEHFPVDGRKRLAERPGIGRGADVGLQ